ncbi:MAG: 50S ribosomal protein L9 [Negativicutes bacterium]|nr:50S ribosomal protein L9 [Negativicutes bacterium]
MEVILTQDVKGIGQKGQKIHAAEGYCRNYLMPRGLAIEATAGALQQMQERDDSKARREQREKEKAQELAKKLAGISVIIQCKHSEGGKLFGSVTNSTIADELSRQHKISIDRKKIEIKEPIKTLGVYEAAVRIYPGMTAKLTIKIHPLD